jgi:AcrR family transcriptional regulator
VSPTRTPDRRPSLRDQHKDRTRRALREAALQLFAVRGYDATTTDEIAETAGVSTRTFFRYFPTKEHALYHGESEWIHDFVDVYPTQPNTLDDLEAMRATLVGLTPHLAKSRQALLLYQRAVDSSPTLRGREQVHHDEVSAILAQAIASRRGRRRADEACLLFACVGLIAYRRAVDIWLAGPANGSLGRAITKEFKLLKSEVVR